MPVLTFFSSYAGPTTNTVEKYGRYIIIVGFAFCSHTILLSFVNLLFDHDDGYSDPYPYGTEGG